MNSGAVHESLSPLAAPLGTLQRRKLQGMPVDLQDVVQDSFLLRIDTIQVEVGVLGHVDGSGFVSNSREVDLERVSAQETEGGSRLDCAWVALQEACRA